MNVFVDPMEEVILEVLLCFQVHHPPRALELDLIEGSFQTCGKGWDFLFITLGDLSCMRTSKRPTVQKN